MEKRQITIAKPTLGDEEWRALRDPITSGWMTQGPKVAAFQEAFAERHQVGHALATTSCTTAMHLILAALEIGPGDEVIVPAFTWVATANVVLYCGATPVFVDVDPATYNMDIDQAIAKITPRTKAILPVHLFGLCADMDALLDRAKGIPVIEDAACAAGSECRGKPAGSKGTAAAFSFHPRKVITTGEGGMVTTQDETLADRMDCLRNHGAEVSEEQRHHGPRPYLMPDFKLLGFNYRMSDLQGAVGLEQLRKLDHLIEQRRLWARFYDQELAEISWLRTPQVAEGFGHSWQAYVCFVDERKSPLSRNRLMDYLQQCGISTRPGTHAVHMLGYYRERFGFRAEDYPVARDCDHYTITLPLHNQMTPEDYRYVASTLRSVAG
jgi:dTDP-4-amino-4,6-dideoxygalactose transaminase